MLPLLTIPRDSVFHDYIQETVYFMTINHVSEIMSENPSGFAGHIIFVMAVVIAFPVNVCIVL